MAVDLVDPAVEGARAGHGVRREAIVEVILVVDVRERVPLRGGLQRHDDDVVVEPHRVALEVSGQLTGSRVLQPLRAVLEQRSRVASVDGHHVQRVLPEVERTLRPRRTEVHPERKHLAVLYETARLDDLLGRDEVQRPELVGVAPTAPVAYVIRDPAKIAHAGHYSTSPLHRRGTDPARSVSPIVPPSTQSTCPVM